MDLSCYHFKFQSLFLRVSISVCTEELAAALYYDRSQSEL